MEFEECDDLSNASTISDDENLPSLIDEPEERHSVMAYGQTVMAFMIVEVSTRGLPHVHIIYGKALEFFSHIFVCVFMYIYMYAYVYMYICIYV
jgi:hypothetical protein